MATTYYVRTDGSDANPGTSDSAGGAKLTVRAGVALLASGDTLIIRANAGNPTTYVETAGAPIEPATTQSGTDWNSPTTIRTLANEERQVVVKRDTAGGSSVCRFLPTASADQKYYILRGLVLDGYKDSASAKTYATCWIDNETGDDNGTHKTSFIRVLNCEIRNCGNGSGVFVQASADNGTGTSGGVCHDVLVEDCYIHDNGNSDLQHNFYIQGYNVTCNRCELSYGGGLGLQIVFDAGALFAGLNCCNNTVSNNKIHHNGRIGPGGSGLFVARGTGNVVFNNLVYLNTKGIRVEQGADGAKIYNNTSVKNTTNNYACGENPPDSVNTLFTNNVARKGGVTVTNFTDVGAATYTITTCLNIAAADTDATDPLFADIVNNDYHLTLSSPAKDAGTLLLEVATDLDGIPRPQGAAHDIGAYEYPVEWPNRGVIMWGA